MKQASRYPIHHRRVLFVGIGGESDTFATILTISALRELGWTWNQCAIAGILSPFHDHTSIKIPTRGLRITHPHSKRSIPTPEDTDEKQIYFVDAHMSSMSRKAMATCEHVCGLELDGGSIQLTNVFKKLACRYDMIVLVQLGGGCLYNGRADVRALTSLSDAIVLRAFVDAQVPGLLYIAGLGSDGEMDAAALRQTICDIGAEPHTLQRTSIDKCAKLYREYIQPIHPDRIIETFFEACHATGPSLDAHFNHLVEPDEYTFFTRDFTRVVNTDLCKRFYLVQPQRIRNPHMVRCKNIKEWVIKTQVRQGLTVNESNLASLRVDNEIWKFAMPSPLFADQWRQTILSHVMQDMKHFRAINGIWILPRDLRLLPGNWERDFTLTDDQGLLAIRCTA